MLYRFSLFVVFATFLLIAAGGLVTSHEAGLAVPDWPTSYGQWFPPMVGNVFWEHGHRMIAGSVGIFTLILAIGIQRTEKRKWLRVLGWTAFGAVIAQALLGGLTVVMMLPPAVSIFHACLAQTFFCLVVSIAYFLSGQQVPIHAEPRLRRLAMMTAGFIYLQLVLGAIVRHTGWGASFHILVAFFVLVHVLLMAIRAHSRTSLALGFLTVIQIFLGIGAFIFTQMVSRSYAPSAGEVFFTAAHQTNGACVLALSVLLILMVSR